MKKLFSIFAALTLMTLSLSAQTGFKKSDKILEGTFSYSKAKGADAEYSVSPSLGYFLTDKFAFGASIRMSSAQTDDFIGVYGRQYFKNTVKNVLTYAQLNVGSQTTNTSGAKTSVFSAGLGLGANYFVSNKVAVSANLCNLMSYSNGQGTSKISIGFNGFNNPIAMTNFGILVKL